ncbi:polynucleotide phosphorylase [Marinisporobacter balticus]|uniref:Uncharacterized protein n=1 Tax=Marinisporobacter balticus TaxID=2018667 RepID=A0A4R2KLL6_9FIRM|nr:polynucleotide phosphorylase [Marinisporobacter balticus]TCO74573.1 hypothetical protein EV214_11251 [Marinisporobacter balticus]
MQEHYLNPLKELNYANLTQEEANKLITFEKQFNNDLHKQVYFMVMEK